MKYKLIKEYPGSPKLGFTTELSHCLGTNDFLVCGKRFNPSEFPEFWQEIVEKDYEILEIQGKYGSISSYKKQYDEDLKDKSIYKIKRLSDGEIFTIGDEIKINLCEKRIKKFEIKNNDLIIWFHSLFFSEDKKLIKDKPGNCCSDYIHNIEKIKQPLFTTEDGVDIFEGDTVWHTNLNTNKKPYSSIVEYIEPFTPVKGLFSTKEKAEEYIIMNKPCLSLKDVKLKLSSMSDTIGMRMLRELVKSKI